MEAERTPRPSGCADLVETDEVPADFWMGSPGAPARNVVLVLALPVVEAIDAPNRCREAG